MLYVELNFKMKNNNYNLQMFPYPFLQVIQLYTADQQNIKYHLSWLQLANKENAPESDVHLKNKNLNRMVLRGSSLLNMKFIIIYFSTQTVQPTMQAELVTGLCGHNPWYPN